MASPQIIKCIDGTRVYFHFLFCAEKKKFTGFNREREQQEQTYASISGIRQTDTHTDLS